ncbi:MAG: TetR/AcrR family transcriptional regulator [Chloroflexi bacterium]|nr:TetR/AcrR family transcriptional regulator [Chloroflexota bacterium]
MIAAMVATLTGTPPLESTTRDAILDASERRFAEAGFDGASTREIAADVGLKNQASLYHYFENKQAIYEAVLKRGVESLLAVIADNGRAGALRESEGAARGEHLAAYLDRTFDYLVAHPHLARLIQRASLDEGGIAREIVARLVQPLFDGGVRLLHDAQGPWPAAELPHVAAGLYHLIFGYFSDMALLTAVMDDDPASEASIARQRSFVRAAVARLLTK